MQTGSSSKINKQKLMDVICNGDVKTAKQLIGEGININFVLDGFTPLHVALKLSSMDMLELLLSQPNIDLNISTEQLSAPLLWSLEYRFSYVAISSALKVPEEFVLRLIRAGCDINLRDIDEATPLHLSVKHGITTITHELLKQGADINAQDFSSATPLYYAVENKYLELVCMLLNYNADVYIKYKCIGHTPYSYALHLEYHEIAEVLSNYYSFLDEDANYIINNYHVFKVFLKYTNAELFKTVWPRFDPKLIPYCKHNFCCFIDCYIQLCKYSTSDWVECLYLILNSDVVFDSIDCNFCNFLCELLTCMRDRHVQSEDRIGLIYMVLSVGVKLTIYQLNYAVATFGLNQNLEPFIYSITYSSITNGSRFFCPLHVFVIRMDTDYSVKRITQLFHDAFKEWNYCHEAMAIEYYFNHHDISEIAEMFAKTIAFFSFSADAKSSLMSIKDRFNRAVMNKTRLQAIPEFPSLTELSRNQIHKYLVQKFRFKQPYQLQDCVKKLLIPNKIKEIILFKQPIY